MNLDSLLGPAPWPRRVATAALFLVPALTLTVRSAVRNRSSPRLTAKPPAAKPAAMTRAASRLCFMRLTLVQGVGEGSHAEKCWLTLGYYPKQQVEFLNILVKLIHRVGGWYVGCFRRYFGATPTQSVPAGVYL